jgi:hypothetical protein
MLAKLFTAEEFIHVFPSLFAIILCILSKYDHYWIDAKVQNAIGGGATPHAGLIASAKQIANGAAALNIHFINVLLFFLGAVLAIFDWPSCLIVWPLIISLILFAFIFYDVLVTALSTPLDSFDRQPIAPNASWFGPWRCLRNLPPSARLRWEQIGFNAIIIALVVIGAVLGGAENARGICKPESPPPKSTEALSPEILPCEQRGLSADFVGIVSPIPTHRPTIAHPIDGSIGAHRVVLRCDSDRRSTDIHPALSRGDGSRLPNRGMNAQRNLLRPPAPLRPQLARPFLPFRLSRCRIVSCEAAG